MAAKRDENGRFVKGTSGNPKGRMSRAKEQAYLDIMLVACSPDKWRKICASAVKDAISGDAAARKWLADYIIGTPVQRTEVTGADGNELRVIYVNRRDTADAAQEAD